MSVIAWQSPGNRPAICLAIAWQSSGHLPGNLKRTRKELAVLAGQLVQ
jgi:hypothetical protein